MDGKKPLTLWELIDSTLSITPGQRAREDVQKLLPWFHERSTVFKQIEDPMLAELVQHVKLQKFRNDFVLVHQGAIGNCFYIVVKGHMAVHAKRDDEIEENEIVAKEVFNAKGPKDRARFGPEMSTLGPGRCFGELCVVSDNKVRNASIITDEAVTLICVEQDVYTRYVPAKFAKELLIKSSFINTHPLFKQWPTAYRNLIIESVQERNVAFGEIVVRQGEPISTIGFVMTGIANICIDKEQHRVQYPYLLNERGINKASNEYRHLTTIQRRKEKWNKGFFAAEVRHRPYITVASVGRHSLVGDVEAVLDLKSHSSTMHCIQQMTIFEIELASFIRIVLKKSPETFEKLRKSVLMKIQYRTSSIQGGVPLYDCLLKSGDGLGKDDTKKILAEALRQRKKQQAALLEKHRDSISGRSGSIGGNYSNMMGSEGRPQRSRKTRMSINPATGEVIVQSMAGMSVDDRRKASEDWEESRRRFSVSQNQDRMASTRGPSTAQAISEKDDLESIAEEEETAKEEGDVAPRKFGKRINWQGANTFLLNAVRITGQRTEKSVDEKKNFTAQEYKNLKRKMQTMSKTTHRVSWSG